MSPFRSNGEHHSVSPNHKQHYQEILKTLQCNVQNESSLTAGEVREKGKDLTEIFDCASSKTLVHENETFQEMTTDLPPCYAPPSCARKTSEGGKYRRRSIERRGAISHLLNNLTASQQEVFLLSGAQSSSDEVFDRPLTTDRSTIRSITTTVLSSNKDHSALYSLSQEYYPPYTTSASCNKGEISEKVNYRKTTYPQQRKKNELPASSHHDAPSKTPVHENETFEEMTKDLPTSYAAPSCSRKTSEGRYRRRSIERRGAISHLLNLSTFQREVFLLSGAQSSSDEVFDRPLTTDRSTNRSITSTGQSLIKDHSAINSSQQYPPYTTSTSCNKISEKVNYRKTTFPHQRKKNDLPASSYYDHAPFDAQQLRKKWEYRRSLQGHSPKKEAYTKRRATRSLVTTTPEWFLPSSSHHHGYCSTKSAAGETQCLSETAAICSLDTDRNSSLRLATNQSDLDVKSSFLFPVNHQDKIIPKKMSPSMLVFSEKSKSAPHLLTGETYIHSCSNKTAYTTDITQEKNRPNKKELCESKSISKMPKSLQKEKNMTPLLRRMSQSAGDIFTGSMVHTSLLRLDSLLQKKEKEDRNILFEEMKKFDDQNLLNFVKGRDTYYAS